MQTIALAGEDKGSVCGLVTDALRRVGQLMLVDYCGWQFELEIEVTSCGRRNRLCVEVEQGHNAEHFAKYMRSVILGMF